MIPDKHGVDGSLDLGIAILVNAARIAPSPKIPCITSNFAKILQFCHGSDWIQIINDLVRDIVQQGLLIFPPVR